jgi:hypothetical protein
MVRSVETRDGKGGLSIGGWGYDLAANKGFRRVLAATPAGVIVGTGVAGGLRPDVPAAIPRIADLNTGWQLYVLSNDPADSLSIYGVIPGTNQLCLFPNGKTKTTSTERKILSPPKAPPSLPPMDSVSTTALGSFDLLNGQQIPLSDAPEHPVPVRRGNNLTVQGRMISSDGTVAFDQVYAVASGVRLVKL